MIQEQITSWNIWRIKQSDSDKEKPFWNIFNLGPSEQFGDAPLEITKHTNKTLCSILAGDDFKLWQELYQNTPSSEVWDGITYQKIRNYRPEQK